MNWYYLLIHHGKEVSFTGELADTPLEACQLAMESYHRAEWIEVFDF